MEILQKASERPKCPNLLHSPASRRPGHRTALETQARPQGGKRRRARQGEEGTGPPPPQLNRQSTGPG